MHVELNLLLLACLAGCGITEKIDSGIETGLPAPTDMDSVADPDIDSVAETDTAPECAVDSATAVDSAPTAIDTATDTGTDTSSPTPTTPTDSGDCGGNDAPCGGCPSGEFCMDCSYYTHDTGTGGVWIEAYECQPCSLGTVCGRPLRNGEDVARADALASDRPVGGVHPTDLSEEHAAALAAFWTDQALDEHASIGSFARFTLELLAHGAPAELVRLAQEAGLDEQRHAIAAFELASTFARERRTAGPIAALAAPMQLAPSLAHLAVATLVDGCVNETIATALATAQLAAATDPAVRAALEAVVADETRHARLAWQTVAWALAVGGPEVREALRLAMARAAPPQARTYPVAVPSHGLLDAATSEAVVAQAWAEVVLPVLTTLRRARVDPA